MGLTIPESPDWESIITVQLANEDLPKVQERLSTFFTLWKMMDGSGEFEALRVCCTRWLDSQSTTHLAVAIQFFNWFPEERCSPELMKLGETRFTELQQISSSVFPNDNDLAGPFLQSIGLLLPKGLPYSDSIKTWMRTQGLRPNGLVSVQFTLIDYDMTWTIGKFKKLTSGSPENALSLLSSLARKARAINWSPLESARHVGGLPGIDQERLSRIIRMYG
jgi:hypothetical protein